MSDAAATAEPAKAVHPGGARLLVWAYRLFPVLLLPLMLVLSRDFGVTWDEKTHQLYGERVYRFLAHGQDDDWFRPAPGLHIYLHGGLFDTVCVAFQKLLSGDIYVTRHYVNAVFGWVGIVFVGLLAKRLAGPGAGLLAMALLALSPRYFGDSMNNPKDVPLAALLAAALYFLMKLEPRYPFLGWRTALGLVISIGLAVSIRAGGLVFLGYLAIALASLTLATRELRPLRLAETLARGLGVVALVMLLGTLFWPWAQLRPLKRPVQGMLKLSQFTWEFPVLFDGRDVPANALPWNYVPQWALITIPPVVWVGVALALWALLRWRSAPPAGAPGPWRVAAILGVALFPGTYVAVSGATIYDGIRHLTFAYPPLVAGAALGWHRLLSVPSPPLRRVALAVLALGMLEPLVFQARNHPNQSVYFNAFAGGPKGAFGRYELDYWGNSLLQGVEWAAEAARASGTKVIVSGKPHHVVRDDSQRFESLGFAREEEEAHQLDVIGLRGQRQDVLELAQRTDILHAVTMADGTPLTVVVPGPRYAEIEGRLRVPPPGPLATR